MRKKYIEQKYSGGHVRKISKRRIEEYKYSKIGLTKDVLIDWCWQNNNSYLEPNYMSSLA